jgi:hypothetical protein
MTPPTSAKNLCLTLGNTVYYRRFIRRYATITTPLETLFKKFEIFRWTPECDKEFNILKEKISVASILIFPNWKIEFHVHVDASSITLGAILVQPREENMDHPMYFFSRKLLQVKHNYKTTESEGITMIYALQNFRHYLLGSHFKFFTEHSALKYLVNKLVLQGGIFKWLVLFKEFSFKVIVKPGRCNVGPDHLSKLESGESGGEVDDHIPYADLFQIKAIPEYIEDIVVFLSKGTYPETYFATKNDIWWFKKQTNN